MKYNVLFLAITIMISWNVFSFNPDELFVNGYYHQDEVLTPEEGIIINAKVDGEYQNFVLAAFPPSFMEWNIKKRKQAINDIVEHQPPHLNGPHNGVVATYGYKRNDSFFALNNSVKGMGFIPRRDTIKELMINLKSTQNEPYNVKLGVIRDLYDNVEKWFDLHGQISLELYSERQFLTQTFLNQAFNPVSTIVYLDIPSYKFKAITQLLDPHDPTLTGYARDLADYANLIHSYFHGEFNKEFIAVIYWAIEIYDNSPGRLDARGLRIVPPMP
ncbi:MAG: hypothetical protein A2328_11365 [Bdellovibrionales bacterium RIFOXYB2_FULL_36_6]|nr:MAG: hypothetical protein A2328_11365 [Bdellovibrionales bacterium RIFOXYB2_FULL_36_6]